jgi:hypothetical protein
VIPGRSGSTAEGASPAASATADASQARTSSEVVTDISGNCFGDSLAGIGERCPRELGFRRIPYDGYGDRWTAEAPARD